MLSLSTMTVSFYTNNIIEISCSIIILFSDATFSVESIVYYVYENDGPIEICAELVTGCLEREIVLQYSTFDATAQSMYIQSL